MTRDAVADRLEARVEEILARWRNAVRTDQRIRSDARLSEEQLNDHVPQIVEQICELIRLGTEPSVSTTDDARANVYMRIRQGYSGPELVWELSLLRMALLGYLADLESDKELGIDVSGYAQLSRIINLYIDLELRYAISVYSDLAARGFTAEDSDA